MGKDKIHDNPGSTSCKQIISFQPQEDSRPSFLMQFISVFHYCFNGGFKIVIFHSLICLALGCVFTKPSLKRSTAPQKQYKIHFIK